MRGWGRSGVDLGVDRLRFDRALEKYTHFGHQVVIGLVKPRGGYLHAAVEDDCGMLRRPISAANLIERRRGEEILCPAAERAADVKGRVVFNVEEYVPEGVELRGGAPLNGAPLRGDFFSGENAAEVGDDSESAEGVARSERRDPGA